MWVETVSGNAAARRALGELNRSSFDRTREDFKLKSRNVFNPWELGSATQVCHCQKARWTDIRYHRAIQKVHHHKTAISSYYNKDIPYTYGHSSPKTSYHVGCMHAWDIER